MMIGETRKNRLEQLQEREETCIVRTRIEIRNMNGQRDRIVKRDVWVHPN